MLFLFFGAHPLSLVVRLIHVAAMASLLGGSLLTLVTLLKPGLVASTEPHPVLSPILKVYEQYFWLAVGLIVMTGVGNLGAFGANLPGPSSGWGIKLGIKLSLVLSVLLISLLRTLLVARRPDSSALPRIARGFYIATTLLLTLILFLGVSLAHG